jgi:hypothetical protein
MTRVRMINAQHPKIKGAIAQTMERRLSPLEEARKMA